MCKEVDIVGSFNALSCDVLRVLGRVASVFFESIYKSARSTSSTESYRTYEVDMLYSTAPPVESRQFVKLLFEQNCVEAKLVSFRRNDGQRL
jgi:hypothetical protein